MSKPILMNCPMPIVTDRLLIRPPGIGDGEVMHPAIIETFDELNATMSWAKTRPAPEDLEEFVRCSAANWILKPEGVDLPLLIFDKSSGLFLGGCGFHHIDWEIPALEVGYWLRKSWQRQGVITEAINALTRYAFEELGAKRLEIRCDIQNSRSRRVAERLGFELEATLKKQRIFPKTNEVSDTLLFVRYDLEGLPEISVTW